MSDLTQSQIELLFAIRDGSATLDSRLMRFTVQTATGPRSCPQATSRALFNAGMIERYFGDAATKITPKGLAEIDRELARRKRKSEGGEQGSLWGDHGKGPKP